MAFGRGRGGPRGGRGRGGFRGGRGNGYNFKNFGGCNFEPCNLRDIFKQDPIVNKEYNNQENDNSNFKPRLNNSNPRVQNGKIDGSEDFNTSNNHKKFQNGDFNEVESKKNHKKFGEENGANNQSFQTNEAESKQPKRKKFKKEFKNEDHDECKEEPYQNGDDPSHDQQSFEVENGSSKILHSFKTDEEDCPFPKLNPEAKQYFKRVYDQLQGTFESAEDEEIFYNNVLEECVGQENFLATTKLGSRCLEKIFVKCKNSKLVRRFLEAFSTDLYLICVDLGATHVTQALLVCCLHLIQNKEEYKVTDKDAAFFEEWVVKIAEFCLENLEDFIFHENNSTYVVRTMLSVLSGKSVESSIVRRVLPKKKGSEMDTTISPSYNYENTPETFVALFKKLAKKLFKNEKLVEIIKTETSCPIVQVLLLVTSESFPKLCQKIIKKIAKKAFTKQENESFSEIFGHQFGSFVVERILESANEKTRSYLWENYFEEQLPALCLHMKGNFVIQKLIKTCQSKEEFEKIFELIEPHLNKIFDLGYAGLFAKLSEACKNLDTCQAKMIKALMVVFHCDEPVERQGDLTKLVINFQRYEDFYSQGEEAPLKVNLSGGLTIQYALGFHKPHKVLMSLINMKEEQLVQLAQDCGGSHIFDAFMQSTFVGEKKRDVLIKKLMPHMTELACSKFGSRCIDSIWNVSSIKSKNVIAEELCKNESTIKGDRFGRFVHRNLALHNFKTRHEEWKQLQNVNTKKRKIFDDIIKDIDTKPVKVKKE